MNRQNIISIVLHRVVADLCIDYEDINISVLNKILSKEPERYITLERLSKVTPVKIGYKYLITFDDGYSSDYEIVFPLMLKMGLQATFFINPSNVGKPGYLNWNMVREMRVAGMQFGSHGNTHMKMTNLDELGAEKEFIKSRESIENNLNEEVSLFSFPYGIYNQQLLDLASKCGYKFCFSSRHGIIQNFSSILPRNSINSSMSEQNVSEVLNPTLSSKIKWEIEDRGKSFVKKTLGDDIYKAIRRTVTKSTN